MSHEPTKQRLAVVVEALDPNRGPDVRVKVGVPAAWLTRRASIRVVLPRLAACALCDGGGCERCSGQGALPLRDMADSPTHVEVHLNPVHNGRTLLIRLPDLGPKPEGEGSRGCVLLEVSEQLVASTGVALVTMTTAEWKPSWHPWVVLFAALVALVLAALALA